MYLYFTANIRLLHRAFTIRVYTLSYGGDAMYYDDDRESYEDPNTDVEDNVDEDEADVR